ncbi:hypothetical protein VPNG_03413 [Cytospora leucostoma]|uniref:Aminotransferase class I/classII large domain-containing protein n=1 Tax=Cytospora leucostoma TaxID=1230097 RepID=A0A423XG35_9PEZI|nr:hypothetical protein VPNG_03413 [Cytospora leucostoma]
MSNPPSPLDRTLGALLSRRGSLSRLRQLSSPTPSAGVEAADFSSNDYLSLSSSPDLKQEFLSRLKQDFPRLGSGGSRLLDGNSSLAESVEKTIAKFHGAEAALLFTSAFDANVGLMSCVPQPGDVVLYDELIHASIHDGLRFSRAGKRVAFHHDSVIFTTPAASTTEASAEECRLRADAGPPSLDEALRALVAGDDGVRVREGRINVFICVEGIYSMDGDVLSLPKLIATMDKHLPAHNGYVIVDEAHSVGVLGPLGRGLVAESPHALQQRVWARVLGFGKAMGCAGGVVLCSGVVRNYLINYARTLIYTTAMSYPSLVALDVVYDCVASGQAEERRMRLTGLVKLAHDVLLAISRAQVGDRKFIRVSEDVARSPIIPVLTRRARSLAGFCQERGFMVRPVVSPTVPEGKERVRVCLHAENTTKEVLGLGKAIRAWIEDQSDGENSHRMGSIPARASIQSINSAKL